MSKTELESARRILREYSTCRAHCQTTARLLAETERRLAEIAARAAA